MKCPACQVLFHDRQDDWERASKPDPRLPWTHIAAISFCPGCHSPIIDRSIYDFAQKVLVQRSTVHPLTSKQVVVDPAVPENLKNDYVEATLVQDISSKASAALSRRILQSILNDQGYANRDLAKQVDSVLSERDPEKVLPLYIRNRVDAIRNFGNFSAHEQKDKVTSEIIDVEPQEAEWCLEIVSDLFEHYYVRPTANAKKLADLNQKLQQAGKPPAK